jgi:conjugal transfer pilus assembly protein TraE
MDTELAHLAAQRVLRQRNALALTSLTLGLLAIGAASAALTRDREVILEPIAHSPLTVSSAGVSKEYLELVTRDAAQLVLNRSPETLDYWMNAILALADEPARGSLKRDLLKVVDEQQGSQITQFFTIDWLRTDPEALTSEVGGVLHTVAGSKEVTAEHRVFRFTWRYTGVSLRLAGFGMVEKQETPA